MRREAPQAAAADSALYDSACDLLDAAQRLRAAAERTGSEQALTPTLGCVAETLKQLAHAIDALGQRIAISEGPEARVVAASESLDILNSFLARGEQLSDSARAAAALLAAGRRRSPLR